MKICVLRNTLAGSKTWFLCAGTILCMYICQCKYIYISVHLYRCIYMYMCTCTYINRYKYVHTHISGPLAAARPSPPPPCAQTVASIWSGTWSGEGGKTLTRQSFSILLGGAATIWRLQTSTVGPTVFRAYALADALEPRVDFAEVVLHRVVGLAFKPKVPVHLHTSLLVPRPYGLTEVSTARKVHFDVRHVVWLGFSLLVEVDARNKNQIARLELVH